MSRKVILHDGDLVAEPGGPTVRACPDGPWLVRGADGVQDEDGTVHATTRPVVAVCACAKTQRGPWCDGTHKVVRPGAGQKDASSRPTRTPAA
jgi:CDGSH-type Zn-finger protein